MRRYAAWVLNFISERVSHESGSRLRRNVIGLVKANSLSLALPFLASPLLTRLYQPEDFAVLAVFVSALTVLLSVVTFRFDYVLPNAVSDAQAASLFAAGMLVLLVGTAIISLALVTINLSVFSDYTLLLQVPHLVWLLSAGLFALGTANMLKSWFIWMGDLRPVGKSTISLAVCNVSASIGLGVLSFSVTGLVGAVVLSSTVGTLVLAFIASQKLQQSFQSFRLSIFSATVKSFRNSAAVCMVSSLCSAAALTTPIFLLAWAYPPKEVGWFMLMHRLVAAPLGTLISALGQGFWSHAASMVRSGSYGALRADHLDVTRKLALLAMPTALFCLAGPFFVGPIFGRENWAGAGHVLLVMAPMFIGSLVFTPTNHLVVLKKKHFQIYTDLFIVCATIASVLLAVALDLGFLSAVALVSASSFVGHFLLFMVHLNVHTTRI